MKRFARWAWRNRWTFILLAATFWIVSGHATTYWEEVNADAPTFADVLGKRTM